MNGLFNAYFYLLLKIRRYIYDPDRKTAGIEYPYAIEAFFKNPIASRTLEAVSAHKLSKKKQNMSQTGKKLKRRAIRFPLSPDS